MLPWVKEIIRSFERHQMTHLHFRQLREDQKAAAVSCLASRPVRLFAVVSNKQSMRGYSNPLAAKAKINVTAWFYVWLSRILIERVTPYCSRKTITHYGDIRSVRFEFGSRGGVKIGDLARYFLYLKEQDALGLMHNTFWKPSWDVMDFEEIHSYPANQRAGIQLADCVASSFYSALEFTAAGIVRPNHAIALAPRMTMSNKNRIYGFGLRA